MYLKMHTCLPVSAPRQRTAPLNSGGLRVRNAKSARLSDHEPASGKPSREFKDRARPPNGEADVVGSVYSAHSGIAGPPEGLQAAAFLFFSPTGTTSFVRPLTRCFPEASFATFTCIVLIISFIVLLNHF